MDYITKHRNEDNKRHYYCCMSKAVEKRTIAMASEEKVRIGGNLGHIEESIDGDLLRLWKAPFCEWRPIRDCTGRYTCREKKSDVFSGAEHKEEGNTKEKETSEAIIVPSSLDPLELIQIAIAKSDAKLDEFIIAHKPFWKIQKFDPPAGRKDCVWVLPLDAEQTIGIISYVKEEDVVKRGDENVPTKKRFVHTLNSPSGFQRKLEAVGIQLQRRCS